jgi:hypothetical protein
MGMQLRPRKIAMIITIETPSLVITEIFSSNSQQNQNYADSLFCYTDLIHSNHASHTQAVNQN